MILSRTFKIFYVEEKVSEFECKSRNAEVLWNNIKKCVLGIMRAVAGRVEEKQESHGLHKILPVKCMKEGSGRISTMTNKWTTAEQRRTN
jgi:hypothetical protein